MAKPEKTPEPEGPRYSLISVRQAKGSGWEVWETVVQGAKVERETKLFPAMPLVGARAQARVEFARRLP